MITGRYQRIPAVWEAILYTIRDSPLENSTAVGCALVVSHFLVQPHKRNACWPVLQWCNDACCLKFVREMAIQISKVLSPNSTVPSTAQWCNSTPTYLYEICLFRSPPFFSLHLWYIILNILYIQCDLKLIHDIMHSRLIIKWKILKLF